MRPSWQTLSNALNMSRKTYLTSIVGLLSKGVCILCIIDSIWAMHESAWIKPDWEGIKSLLLRKLYIILSNICCQKKEAN